MPLRRPWLVAAVAALAACSKPAGQPAAEPGAATPMAATPAAGAEGTWRATLPAADSPGRVIELVLFAGGKAQMVTDFQKGSPVLEDGSWLARDDGTIAVSLGRPDVQPTLLVFRRAGTTLELQDPVAAGYGSEGLRLERQ